ncbi:MAG TPA: thioredoxin domain-containing protein, partial [Methylomirabilota bacterium]|nr:thioredoxin domain-containing protein [Methylomirabilota bacterium]
RTESAATAALADARAKLLAVRGRRVRPHRDDKVITAWNGLMIAALAHGARALDEPELAGRAAKAAEFVWTRLRNADGGLLRRYRDGEAAVAGQLDDHAYFARACLELHAATHEPRWLERAAAVTDAMLARFWDDGDGAFFESPSDANGIAIRMKDGHDGAELAGNSVASEVLLRLATLLERADWRVWAERSLTFHSRQLKGAPQAMPWMLSAMERGASPPRHTVIVGPRDRDDTRALIREYESRLRPDDDLVVVSDDTRDALARWVPFAAKMPERDGRATAYVCRDYACRLPVHEPAEMAALLEE